MIHDIARSAVIRKTQKDVNIITGNYEAAYALGLLARIGEVSVSAVHKDVLMIKQQVFDGIVDYKTKNDREAVLIRMLKDYKPSKVWDEDVEAMLQMGLEEKIDVLETESFFRAN